MNPFWPEGEPINVRTDKLAAPRSFTWQGRTHRVRGIAKRWRVDQRWWRQRIWREYFKLHTDSGLLLVLYRDVLRDAWYLQRLYD